MRLHHIASRATALVRPVGTSVSLPAASAALRRPAFRGYTSQLGGSPVFQVFNRQVKWLQKERAAANVEASRQTDYLKDEVAFRLCERLLDIKRTFPEALDFGANSCNMLRALARENPDSDPARPLSEPLATRIGHLTAAESSEGLLMRDAELPWPATLPASFSMTRHVISPEEEEAVGAMSDAAPFAPGSYDLVLSSLSLHWINDLPGALAQINRLLRPDCPFLGAMLGGDSLFELRTSLQLAEQERRGGMSPHVSPLADVRDVGGLMQRAGFNMLTVDVEDIVVDYPDSFALMADLQAMGESNAVLGREMGPVGRDVLLANDAIYRSLHGNADGTIPATFRVIYMIGWHPSENQPKPLPRGSGQISLKDVLEKK